MHGVTLLPYIVLYIALLYVAIRTAVAIWQMPGLLRDISASLREIRLEIRKLAKSEKDLGATEKEQSEE